MFETLGLDSVTPRQASVVLGLGLGVIFGALALATGFCLRRAITGPREERREALGLWMVALAAAVIGTQAAVMAGLVTFADHRFLSANLPVLAVGLGGALFGGGMVLSRGCGSRLTVLAATGNLRAALVVLTFALVGLATMRGTLAPLRLWLAEARLPMGGALPGHPLLWMALTALGAVLLARRGRIGAGSAAMGILLGLTVPVGWIGTGLVLQDDFDPIPMEGPSFVAPTADTLFWGVAAIAPNFGVGLVGGVLLGSLVLALLTRRFRWQSFSTPGETGRYLIGGALMGFGGALAGGCTVGAGLSGLPTLGLAAVLALLAIILGAAVANAAISVAVHESAGPETTPTGRPTA